MNYCKQGGRWGQDAGDGSMARACLPALTALGQTFCPEERDLHTQDPSCEGYSGAGWERQSPKLAIHQLGTLSAQETCTPQTGAMVTCCVTSGKFCLLSGLWLIFKRSWNSGFTSFGNLLPTWMLTFVQFLKYTPRAKENLSRDHGWPSCCQFPIYPASSPRVLSEAPYLLSPPPAASPAAKAFTGHQPYLGVQVTASEETALQGGTGQSIE